MDLTPKQEKFVQGLVMGLSKSEAYRQAYNCEKMKDTTIEVKASELFNNGKVTVRYEKLVNEFKDKALYTREQANSDYEWAKKVAKEDVENRGLKQANINAFLTAVKGQVELNGLLLIKDNGENKEDKQAESIANAILELRNARVRNGT